MKRVRVKNVPAAGRTDTDTNLTVMRALPESPHPQEYGKSIRHNPHRNKAGTFRTRFVGSSPRRSQSDLRCSFYRARNAMRRGECRAFLRRTPFPVRLPHHLNEPDPRAGLLLARGPRGRYQSGASLL